MEFVGRIDDFDGLIARRRMDADFYDVRLFSTKGEGRVERLDRQMCVSFDVSFLLNNGIRFIEEAAKAGKKLRITVEAVE